MSNPLNSQTQTFMKISSSSTLPKINTMEEITGSLNYFIRDFPNKRRYLQILETSKRPALLSPITTPKKLRYPRSTEHKSKKFSFESKSLVFKKMNPSILSSIESKSIRKLSPQDQLQGELM